MSSNMLESIETETSIRIRHSSGSGFLALVIYSTVILLTTIGITTVVYIGYRLWL